MMAEHAPSVCHDTGTDKSDTFGTRAVGSRPMSSAELLARTKVLLVRNDISYHQTNLPQEVDSEYSQKGSFQ